MWPHWTLHTARDYIAATQYWWNERVFVNTNPRFIIFLNHFQKDQKAFEKLWLAFFYLQAVAWLPLSYIMAADIVLFVLASDGCLQYFTGVSGQAQTFNYNSGSGLQVQ